MARTILTALLIVLLNVLVGCNDVDRGRGQLMPPGVRPALVLGAGKSSEADIAERVVVNRKAYREGLTALVEHYTQMGDNMKLQWAKKELSALEAMPQYTYIVEASLAGPDLKASISIPDADYLYRDASQLEKKAKELIFIVDENLLRLALDKYNQLIKNYPSSDKIDDAAYRAGEIHEHFKDYTVAVLYYQRAFQWNPDTLYPARFKAAYILDRRLHRRAEALELYQEAIKKQDLRRNYKEFAEMRITEITKSEEGKE